MTQYTEYSNTCMCACTRTCTLPYTCTFTCPHSCIVFLPPFVLRTDFRQKMKNVLATIIFFSFLAPLWGMPPTRSLQQVDAITLSLIKIIVCAISLSTKKLNYNGISAGVNSLNWEQQIRLQELWAQRLPCHETGTLSCERKARLWVLLS